MVYYFDNNIGISLAYNYINLENTQDAYKNTAKFHNFRMGVNGRLFEESLLGLFFSTGVNLVPNYTFKIPMRFSNPQGNELSANGATYGLYLNAGLSIRVYKGFVFFSSFDYTYIPVVLKYSTTIQNHILEQTETTNMNGLGIQAGLAYRF